MQPTFTKHTGMDIDLSSSKASAIFIRSAFALSPQWSFESLVQDPRAYKGDRLICVEPDYATYIDAKLIRRMSRLIKMGAYAAMECLAQAGETMPGAIITGTAYGCLEDTDHFLTRMVEFNETLLSPTAFIQSTHNTVGAQIALMLKCHQYNNTYVHRGSSFESALMDAWSLMEEGSAESVLLGGLDEIIEKSHAILKRFGLYKTTASSEQLLNSDSPGTMAGEGAAFFLLQKNASSNDLAKLVGFKSFYKYKGDMASAITEFLKAHQTNPEDIDLVMMGKNGDARYDGLYDKLSQSIFKDVPTINFKQYCGEYPTAGSFGLWLASQILASGHIPGLKVQNPPRKILMYNNYQQQYPALYLLSAC